MKCLTIFLAFLILCHVYDYVSSIRSLKVSYPNAENDKNEKVRTESIVEPLTKRNEKKPFNNTNQFLPKTWNNGDKIGAQAYAAFSPKAPKAVKP